MSMQGQGTRPGRVAVLGAVHEALPMLQALLRDRRVDVVAVLTPGSSQAAGLAGAVDLGALARAHRVPVLAGLDLRSDESLRILAELRLDLMVVVGWTRLVPPAVLSLPRHGCVGFHASMLPAHRGRAPVNWAIIRGEERTGATMLMLDAGVDTGSIIDQEPIGISSHDTCATIYARVASAGVRMLRQHLAALLVGHAPLREQASGGDLLPKRTPGMGITDWSMTAREVHDWVRALTHPYPGAFSLVDGSTVRLWRAEPGPPLPRPAPPGGFLGCLGDGVVVAASDGTVRLLRVEEDGVEQPAASWFSSRDRSPGGGFDPVDPAVSRWARGLGPAPAVVAGSR